MKNKFAQSFQFKHWFLNTQSFELSLFYALDGNEFCEVLSFPDFDRQMYQQRKVVIERACNLVHLLSGVSYYKAGLASSISCEQHAPSLLTSRFIERTWYHGLAELAYKNGVSLKGRINIPSDESHSPNPIDINFKQRTLLPMGGGKDSLVSLEEMKKQGKDISLFMVGQSSLIKDVAQFVGLPILQVKRQIDRKLIDYNNQGAFNGHVPITAINSAIALLCTLLFDYDEIVFSNEKSADSGNTINKDGDLVNHQYSKSLAFEKDFMHIINAEMSGGIKYYSQQRQSSELAILKKFSHYPQYFPIFSSCNRNFHIDGSKNKNTKWCCNCPKCRFVFLGLAPFVEKQQLIRIFAANLLNEKHQQNGFAELLGIKGFKPFECVGELTESQLAFNLIKDKAAWKDDTIIKIFAERCPAADSKQHNELLSELNNI
jgi:hypothetical protein